MSLLSKFLHRVVSNPWAFDWLQNRMGLRQHWPRLAPYLAQTGGQIVLDIGAGTGNYTSLLPQSATYLGLDIDPKKLHAFEAKWPFDLSQGQERGLCALCCAIASPVGQPVVASLR